MRIFLALYLLALVGCNTPPRQTQQQKIAAADSTLNAERTYLQVMRDSLPIKIQENLKLGLSQQQSEAIEQALINSQIAVVKAAEQNLKLQKALSDSLQKYQRQ